MSGYLNRVQLIGNLGNDPEVRVTQAGKKIVTLSIATGESWNDANTGERRERTEWHRVVIFNDGLAKLAERYLVKGAKVLVEGKLATNKWTDNEGRDRYTTEIQVQPYSGTLTFLDTRKNESRASGGERAPARETAMAGAGGSTGAGFGGDLDDDVPFAACWQ